MRHDYPVKSCDVRSNVIHGKIFRPASSEKVPGIIVFGGSGGGLGWSDSMAYSLAREGYGALALAYFGYADLPKGLTNIPIEYFQNAFDWMVSRKDIDTEKLTLIGGSRGAELALLLASYFSIIRAVVGYAASAVVWGANGGPSSINKAAWVYNDRSIPHMKLTLSAKIGLELARMLHCLYLGKTFHASSLLEVALEDLQSVEQSIIKVENINGPILLISGCDDNLLPAVFMSEMVMARLARYRHPFTFKHLCYEGAGHSINAPGLSVNEYPAKLTHMLTRLKCDLGGKPAVNATASELAWQEVKKFLAHELRC